MWSGGSKCCEYQYRCSEFWGRLFYEGLSYSAINMAHSALSSLISINHKPVGSHPLVIHFLKGVFNTRPTLPQTNVTWDPQVVLDYLQTLSPTKQLSLKRLTLKMVMLLWSVTGQRGQSIQLIDRANLTVGEHCQHLFWGLAENH